MAIFRWKHPAKKMGSGDDDSGYREIAGWILPGANIKDIAILALAINVKRAEEDLRKAYGGTLSGGVPKHVAASVRKLWIGSHSALGEIRIVAAHNRKIIPFPVKRLKGKR